MLVAIAFLCLASSADCEREAVARVVVGGGATPNGCLMDGMFGAAADAALVHGNEYRIVISCRPRDAVAHRAPKSSLACDDSGGC